MSAHQGELVPLARYSKEFGSSPMVTPQAIESYIREKLDCQHLSIEGDGAHFQAVIVSEAFAGKSRVQRHQIVYGALGERMREEIHALSMQTLTTAEWSQHPSHSPVN